MDMNKPGPELVQEAPKQEWAQRLREMRMTVADEVVSKMRDVKSELLHVRELLGVLVRRERCAEVKTEIAVRRLDKMENEKDEVACRRQVVSRQGLRLWQSPNWGNRLHPRQCRVRRQSTHDQH